MKLSQSSHLPKFLTRIWSTRRGKIHQPIDERAVIKELWRQKAESTSINHPQPTYSKRKQLPSLQSQHKLLTEAIAVTGEKQVAFPKQILLKELLRQSQGNFDLKDLQQELTNNKNPIETNDGRLTTLAAIKREKQREVYYQKFQERDNDSSSTLSEAKKRAIASFQKQLEQQTSQTIAGE